MKYIFLFAFILMIPLILNCQDTIVYNFKDKKIETVLDTLELKQGDFVKIKVTNINPYLFSISTNASDSNFASTTPDFFSSLVTTLVGAGPISSFLAGPKNVPTTPEVLDDNMTFDLLNLDVPMQTDQESQLVELRNSLIKDLINTPSTNLRANAEILQKLVPILFLEQNLLSQKFDQISQSKTNDQDKKFQITDEVFNNILILDTIHRNAIAEVLKFATIDIELDKITLKNDLPKIGKLLKQIDSLSYEFSKLPPDTSSSIDSYFKGLLEKVKASDYFNKFSEIQKIINNHAKTNEYVSAPIYVSGDEMEFTLNITPDHKINNRLSLPLNSEKISLKIPVRRSRFTFSADIFINPSLDKVSDYTITFDPSETDTIYSIIEEQSKPLDFGGMMSLNLLCPVGKKSSIGPYLGLGAILKEEPDFLLSLGATYKPDYDLPLYIKFGFGFTWRDKLKKGIKTENLPFKPDLQFTQQNIVGLVLGMGYQL